MDPGDRAQPRGSRNHLGFVTARQLANKLGVTTELVRVWIKDGKLSAVQSFPDEPKGWHLIPLPEAERFLDRLSAEVSSLDRPVEQALATP